MYGGRLLVGPGLRVEGQDRIFAVGDIALSEAERGAGRTIGPMDAARAVGETPEGVALERSLVESARRGAWRQSPHWRSDARWRRSAGLARWRAGRRPRGGCAGSCRAAFRKGRSCNGVRWVAIQLTQKVDSFGAFPGVASLVGHDAGGQDKDAKPRLCWGR